MTSSPNSSGIRPPDPFTSQLQLGAPRWPSFLLLGVVLAAALSAGFLFFTGRLVLRPDPNSPKGKTLALKDLAAENVEFAELAEGSVNKLAWETALAKLTSAQKVQQKLRQTHEKLKAEFSRLADGPEGKRIASNESLVDQFIAVRDRERLSDDELETKLRAINTLRPICETALKKNVIVKCDESLLNQANSILADLADAAKIGEEDLESVDALIRSSKDAAPAMQTLSQATAARADSRKAAALAKLTEEQERQRLEIENKAREQQLANERAIAEANLAREKAEQEIRAKAEIAKAEQAKLELKKAEQQRERDRVHRERVAKFESALPGVKSLLSPFISHGRMHYAAGRGWREGEPGPLSLDALKSTGILRDDPTSLSIFTNFCLASPRENDRPLGSFPATTFRSEGSAAQIQREIQRAQSFLREYGDLLVERGLLLP